MATDPEPSDPADAASSPTDFALARAAGAGEPNALRELLERLRCVPRVLAVLNTRCGSPLNEHDLADLAQDTIILVWKKLGVFREHATFEPWAYGIARLEFQNLARRRRRAARREVEIALDEQPGVAEDPTDEADLERWVAWLTPEQAQVVLLKHEEGLTFEEIAVRASINTNTAKTRYYRALRAIESELAQRTESGAEAEARKRESR